MLTYLFDGRFQVARIWAIFTHIQSSSLHVLPFKSSPEIPLQIWQFIVRYSQSSTRERLVRKKPARWRRRSQKVRSEMREKWRQAKRSSGCRSLVRPLVGWEGNFRLFAIITQECSWLGKIYWSLDGWWGSRSPFHVCMMVLCAHKLSVWRRPKLWTKKIFEDPFRN